MKYKIADLIEDITYKYGYTGRLLNGYEYLGDEPADIVISVSDKELDEAVLSDPEFPRGYHENLCIYRKLCTEILMKYDGLLFHCSAVEYNGKAYVFTAPSGTGKSTHSNLLKQYLGDNLSYINDDKPIMRYFEKENCFYVYGTPWNGKHHRGENKKAPLSCICLIRQNRDNVIERIDAIDALQVLLNQTIRPNDEYGVDKLICMLSKLNQTVKFYKLGCNMDISAAETSFKAMMENDK